MTGVAIGLFFVTVFLWVPAAWVFFDSQDRGHSSYLWGALTLIFSLPALVVYFIVRSRWAARPGYAAAEYSRSRIYFHVAVVTFWGLTTVAATAAMFGVYQWVGASEGPFDDRGRTLREALAFGLPLLLIAVPATAVHVVMLRRRVAAATGPVRESLSRLLRGLESLMLVLGGLIATAAGISALFGLSGSLFDVGGFDRDGWAFTLSTLVTSLLSVSLTRLLFTEAVLSGARTAPPAPTPPVAPEAAPVAARIEPAAPSVTPPDTGSAGPVARFCAGCGSTLISGARFCSACGITVDASA